MADTPPPPPAPTQFRDRLTPSQIAQISAWLAQKRPVNDCPSCKLVNTFSIAEHMVAPPVFAPGGGLMLGGASYPYIMLTCRNCGLTLFYNAVIMGIAK
jgi:predicted nucleic-acid-binding Zn-ribbon protein